MVIASGGNAGLAAACAANARNVKCSVYMPLGASESTIQVLREQNADVVLFGNYYQETLQKVGEVVSEEKNA